MKLNKKFFVLILSLDFVTIALSTVLLTSFSKVIELKNYENKALEMRFNIYKLLSYNRDLFSASCNREEMLDKWNILLTDCYAIVDDFYATKDKVNISKETLEEIEASVKLWEFMKSGIEKVTRTFEDFVAIEMPKEVDSAIKSKGITSGVYSKKIDGYDTVYIEYNIQKLSSSTLTLETANSNFEVKFFKIADMISNTVKKEYSALTIIGYTTALIASIIISVLSSIMTSRITHRVKTLQKITSQLAIKDFTSNFQEQGNDEIACLSRDLNETISILSKFLSSVKQTSSITQRTGVEINNSAGATATATYEISSNVDSLRKQFDNLNDAVNNSMRALEKIAEGANLLITANEKQSESISKSNKSIFEMVDAVENISKTASEKYQSAIEMKEIVADGDEKISVAVSILKEVNDKLGEISEVVEVINNIAEQTNILSMNAAIESAHAGEVGQGFGVVAEEIRVLAESTTENSKRIHGTISTIIEKVRDANLASNDAAVAFGNVHEKSNDLLLSLSEIATEINTIESSTKNISDQSKQISEASKQMNMRCENLHSQQELAINEMNTMNDIFTESLVGIDEIKLGTNDIASKMLTVRDQSNDSLEKMTALNNALEEFKTEE